MSSDHKTRPIAPIELGELTPNAIDEQHPTFEWVDPRQLKVDESYQRNLSRRSKALIRQIVTNWDWRRFKPPIVAETDDGLEVIDGQHTAIAACMHPSIAEIPVMRVEAPARASRAGAFLGHNRDRISITSTQMYFAARVAEDPGAVTVAEVCQAAGIEILKGPTPRTQGKAGQTMAVAAIVKLIDRRGRQRAEQVLRAAAAGSDGLVSASAIRATDTLLHDEEFVGGISAEEITATLRSLGVGAEREAKLFAATHKVPLWRALAAVIFKNRPRPGRRARVPEPAESAE